MNKSVLLGIAAFGGLILIGVMLSGNNEGATEVTQEIPAAMTIPADFESQFPLYPKSTVVNLRESESESSIDVSVGLESTDSRTLIFEWYATELSQNGWSIKSDKNVAGYRIIQAEKENLYTTLQVASGDTPDTERISQQLKVRKE